MSEDISIRKLLVANRAEIAMRVIRTAKRMGIATVAVYSEGDAKLPHVSAADEARCIGSVTPADSYLNMDKIIAVAHETGAQAIHPGYGFLSENAEFAQKVMDAGCIWVGPTPESMRSVADKIAARNLMEAAGVPVAKGTRDPISDVGEALKVALQIGYPLMVKPSGGGGGIGMSVVHDADELTAGFERAVSLSNRFFGSSRILLEKYISSARHVEVQILGLNDGTVLALGERDCSVQRRNQKVVEESPSPGVGSKLRSKMLDAAVKAGSAVGYRNAGTVECLVNAEKGDFVFIEMNTRLQVEHGVTEEVEGIDLVEAQLRIAAGLAPQFDAQSLRPHGHAIELRVYAEDPIRFLPGPGEIRQWVLPTGEGVRVDAGYDVGNKVSIAYDPLMAKLIVYGDDREMALARAREAVDAFVIIGPKSNLPFLAELLRNPVFVSGNYDTSIVKTMRGN